MTPNKKKKVLVSDKSLYQSIKQRILLYIGITDSFNNHTNIVFGAKYISYCFVKDKVTIKDVLNKFYKGKYY